MKKVLIAIKNCWKSLYRKNIQDYQEKDEIRPYRVAPVFGEGRTRVYYTNESVASCDDVYLESENELLYTPSQKKEMIFKL